MNSLTVFMIITSIVFFLILASGFWLRKTGSPYKTGIVTLHKLVSVAFVAINAMLFIRWSNMETDHTGGIWVIVCQGLMVLSALITGGLLSYKYETHFLLILGHRISTVIIFLTMGIWFVKIISF